MDPKDQDPKEPSEETPEEETPEEEPEEETPEEPSEEPDEEPITPERAFELAKAVQKGYTQTRQEFKEIRDNQETIQKALDEIRKGKEAEPGFEEEEPLTVSKFLQLQKQQAEQKETEDKKIKERIDSQLAELRAQEIVKSEKEEEELINYAVKHKITDLFQAAKMWQELQQAKKEGVKEGAKGKVKGEAGSKVGTSQKTGTKEQGFDYGEIHDKSMDEIAEGE